MISGHCADELKKTWFFGRYFVRIGWNLKEYKNSINMILFFCRRFFLWKAKCNKSDLHSKKYMECASGTLNKNDSIAIMKP